MPKMVSHNTSKASFASCAAITLGRDGALASLGNAPDARRAYGPSPQSVRSRISGNFPQPTEPTL
jgi:hypothetical protein